MNDGGCLFVTTHYYRYKVTTLMSCTSSSVCNTWLPVALGQGSRGTPSFRLALCCPTVRSTSESFAKEDSIAESYKSEDHTEESCCTLTHGAETSSCCSANDGELQCWRQLHSLRFMEGTEKKLWEALTSVPVSIAAQRV